MTKIVFLDGRPNEIRRIARYHLAMNEDRAAKRWRTDQNRLMARMQVDGFSQLQIYQALENLRLDVLAEIQHQRQLDQSHYADVIWLPLRPMPAGRAA